MENQTISRKLKEYRGFGITRLDNKANNGPIYEISAKGLVKYVARSLDEAKKIIRKYPALRYPNVSWSDIVDNPI